MSRSPQRFLLSSSALLILLATTATGALAQCPTPAETGAENHLNMLVLGDSILWGQGLREQQKSWFRVKCWLQNTTGRIVDVVVKAHSGAMVERSPGQTQSYSSPSGEVNLPLPSINEELDEAVRQYGDPTKVDLVLVDGCINDVDVRNLLNASVNPDLIRERATDSCGVAMARLLRRITTSFPNAHVIVPGYYRIVSTDTEDNAFIRLLVKKLAGQSGEGSRMTDKERRDRLIVNSEEFYRVSNARLQEAIKQVNEELNARSSRQKILFADIQFWPEHAFSAKDTLLWTFVFASTNLSGFRKLLVILTFGTSAYKPNDVVRKQRVESCKETYKKPKGQKETKDQKQSRENHYLACRYASLGHPNQMGALIYAESIKGQLQWLIPTTGWLRKPAAATMPN
ncbi:MAG TPA: SGNH/GDSL hydrolase family protein [Pyrinomonadaceae bacterium]|nr:SGNH/GDSL hydrolase family protein [Pyrinomonadaceae bacterium]